jgi:hypothetical protein
LISLGFLSCRPPELRVGVSGDLPGGGGPGPDGGDLAPYFPAAGPSPPEKIREFQGPISPFTA